MRFALPEIQITFIIIMALLSIVIAFIVPHYAKVLKEFVVSRRLLLAGTVLITIHFILQYALHKSTDTVESTRILINMLFGYPICYFISMSMLNMLRRGHVRTKEWLTVPGIYVIALLFLVLSRVIGLTPCTSMTIMAIMYLITIIYTQWLVMRRYASLLRLRRSGMHTYDMMLRWTQWSIPANCVISLGLPFMAFVNDIPARSIYGIVSIALSFFLIIGILGYVSNFNYVYSIGKNGFSEGDKEGVINDEYDQKSEAGSLYGDASADALASAPGDDNANISDSDDADAPEDSHAAAVISPERLAKVTAASERFVKDRIYTRPGISLSEAARYMGVSVNLLKNYLRTTEYQKFSNWIVMLRLEYSKQLMLTNHKASNDVIAEKCGFCDRQYFQTLFMKHMGMRPSKWLREKIGPED